MLSKNLAYFHCKTLNFIPKLFSDLGLSHKLCYKLSLFLKRYLKFDLKIMEKNQGGYLFMEGSVYMYMHSIIIREEITTPFFFVYHLIQSTQ